MCVDHIYITEVEIHESQPLLKQGLLLLLFAARQNFDLGCDGCFHTHLFTEQCPLTLFGGCDLAFCSRPVSPLVHLSGPRDWRGGIGAVGSHCVIIHASITMQ